MTMSDERRVYELGYHMVSTLTEEELAKNIDSLRKAITDLKGTFVSEGEPALVDLAYNMYINTGGKNILYEKAYFGWMKFEINPSEINHLEYEVIKENKKILRYLLIKTVTEDTRAKVNLDELKEVKNEGTIKTPEKIKKEEKEEKNDDDTVSDEKNANTNTIKEKESSDNLDATIDKLLDEE